MTKSSLENLPSDKMGIHKKARRGNSRHPPDETRQINCSPDEMGIHEKARRGNSSHPPDETGQINCPPDELGIHISSLQKILQVVGNHCMWASTKDKASCREY